jgi:hypothetical protein
VKYRDSQRLNALTASINTELFPLTTGAKIKAAVFVNGDGGILLILRYSCLGRIFRL